MNGITCKHVMLLLFVYLYVFLSDWMLKHSVLGYELLLKNTRPPSLSFTKFPYKSENIKYFEICWESSKPFLFENLERGDSYSVKLLVNFLWVLPYRSSMTLQWLVLNSFSSEIMPIYFIHSRFVTSWKHIKHLWSLLYHLYCNICKQ